ncbi:zinc-dependent alcohol dehydrogenase family protein [Polyangium aurulentum]|uniref:zinc-dependent alcohol dehydrogenase family protein n=1 Tax=Polyangium aurulentum TaxID=2567896 RepID=UPI0019817859|nr:NAD(P)-dependent alcohol dehydrogenase [Polyangium aurulentum]UQA63357.1 NAD(P)-dependent alcohol dehydrogenase [Polyangium aurulentum]
MKAIAIQGSFGLDSLALVDLPDPTPGPGQIVVRMRAASLNFRDLLTVKGLYNPRQPLPLVPLSDGAGEVVEVGAGVTRVKKGDRVCPIFTQGWIEGQFDAQKLVTTLGGPLPGVLSELFLGSEHGVVKIPAHLTDAEAATLPCAAVTAWNALFDAGQTKPGDTVLVQGTGGVSIFALQFAVAAGARVIVTSSSDEKLERARQLGAWGLINYKTNPDWDKRALEMTGGVGVDHVIEVGGAGTFTRSMRAVRMAGTVSVIGVLAGVSQELSVIPMLMKGLRIQGLMVGSRVMFEAMNRAIEAKSLRPVIDRSFPFAEARQALTHMESGAHFGKIVLEF